MKSSERFLFDPFAGKYPENCHVISSELHRGAALCLSIVVWKDNGWINDVTTYAVENDRR